MAVELSARLMLHSGKAPYVGAWEDREDIQDSVKFAEELRRRWERRGQTHAILLSEVK